MKVGLEVERTPGKASLLCSANLFSTVDAKNRCAEFGGFFDDEVNALLGLDRERIVVYITCLGKPAAG